MAQHKAAKKHIRQTFRRHAINKKNKTVLRRQIKRLRTAIENKDKKQALKLLPETFSVIDQAAKKGTIHHKTADRYKSRLNKKVSSIPS
ncbi:MAG: 30S ribosomal protein S20 [Candidatus Aminicenantes bacterium]|nr:30S ribosomal protein S20 [Candidatus Aminicenantes bacterium]